MMMDDDIIMDRIDAIEENEEGLENVEESGNNSSFEGGEDFEVINKDLWIDIDDKYTLEK